MILEFNKFNVILYFLIGISISVGLRRWIYGSLIVAMSVFMFLHNTLFTKDSSITKFPSFILLIIIIIVSLFILNKSSIEVSHKLFSITFLLFSSGFSLAKYYFKDTPIFSLSISDYIPNLLLMIALISISIIPDNQLILRRKYLDVTYDDKEVKSIS